MHAGALQPITSLCTLRWHRYRCQRHTQYLVLDHGFQDWDFHLANKAELCSAHIQRTPNCLLCYVFRFLLLAIMNSHHSLSQVNPLLVVMTSVAVSTQAQAACERAR